MKLLLLSALFAAVHAVDYTFTANTTNMDYAGTSGAFFVTAWGYDGKLINFDLNALDKSADTVSSMVFSSEVDLGALGCMVVRAGSTNAWMINDVTLASSSQDKELKGTNENVNTAEGWLSSDTSEAGDKGILSMMWCAEPRPSASTRVRRGESGYWGRSQ